MGLLTTALQIGRSALLSYQSALQAVGNNISNASSTSYTRQTPILTPQMGAMLPEGFQAGAGVALTSLKRNIDEALESRLRQGVSDQGSMTVQQQALGRIEAIVNELTDHDLSTLMSDFFSAFSSLRNNPADVAQRGVVINTGVSLVTEIRRQRVDVMSLRDELNGQVEDLTAVASRLAGEIAGLNTQIIESESRLGGVASALRDQRDAKLRELSDIIEVDARPTENGGMNVYLGNDPLVQGGLSRGLKTELFVDDGSPRMVVEFADNNGKVALRGGQLEGLVEARDTHAKSYLDDLDTLAAALIQEVNKVHSQGQGLSESGRVLGLTNVLGTYGVDDADAALNDPDAAGLDLTPRNGSFKITVTNVLTGASQTATIAVDLDGLNGDDTTLNSLAAAINAHPRLDNLTATVLADGRLRIASDDASVYEFTFSEDSSNVLAALGINTFFTGTDAHDIDVNAYVASNGNLLAAGRSNLPGDGDNAAAIAALQTAASDLLGGQSITAYYNNVVGRLAISGSAAKAGSDAASSILTSLQAQRESISGVSLDEEAITLIKFERAFQGAARYVTVVNELLDEMINLAR